MTTGESRSTIGIALLATALTPSLGWGQTCTWGGTPALLMPTVATLRSDARLLAAPARLAVDLEGKVYVTDPPAGRILVRDGHGRLVRVLEGLGRPLGVAVDSYGVVYVGDESNGSVQLIDADGRLLRKLGRGDGEFQLPGHIAMDHATGVVYVADGGANEVKGFRDGMSVARFGGTGSAAGLFSFPTGIHVSEAGEIFVADQNNDRVQVFDRAGAFQRCFGKTSNMTLKPRFGRAQGLAGDSIGRVYVADAFQGTVKVFDAAGVLLGTIGRFGERTGELQLPQSLVVDSHNRLLVASTGNARVEVFGLDGYVDPHVVDASARLARPAVSPSYTRSRRFPLWAVVEVRGHGASEIVRTSLTANGVGAWGAGPRRDGRFWASFDHGSVTATLPAGVGWVSVRGQLLDGAEFEATEWLGPVPPPTRPEPRGPTRRYRTAHPVAARGPTQ